MGPSTAGRCGGYPPGQAWLGAPWCPSAGRAAAIRGPQGG